MTRRLRVRLRVRLRPQWKVRLPEARRRTDARVDRAWPSDARRSEEPKPGVAPDPEVERRQRLRRAMLFLFLSLIFVGSSLAAVFGESGFLDLRRRHREIAELEQELTRREAQVASLAGYVRRLETDPQAIERIAREDLGLVKPGEIIFLLPREDAGEAAEPGGTPPTRPEPEAP